MPELQVGETRRLNVVPYDRYLKKEINCRTSAAVIAYVKKYLPLHYDPFVKQVAALGLSESYLCDEVNWVSFEFINLMYDRVYEITNDPFIMYTIGSKVFDLLPKSLPFVILQLFRSPQLLFKQSARFSYMFEKISKVSILDVGRSFAVIEEEFEEYRQTWHSYQYGRGLYSIIPSGAGCELVSAEMLECSVPIYRTQLYSSMFQLVGKYVYDRAGNKVAHRDEPFKYRGTLFNSKNDVHKIIWKRERLFFRAKYKSAEHYKDVLERLEHDNKELEKKAKLEMELELAKRVQDYFLPSRVPDSDQWDISFISRPKEVVSGDFYDFYVNNNKASGVGLFDVSGHGISAGFIMLLAKSIIFRKFNQGRDQNLAVVMKMINEELIDEIKDSCNYLSGLLVRFNEDKLEYSSAAHPFIVFRSAGGDVVRYMQCNSGNGALLGIELTKNESFYSFSMDTRPGDSFLLYTDGLTEETNAYGSQYGDRVLDSMKQIVPGSAKEMLSQVLNDFYRFSNRESGFADDITVIMIKRR